MVEQHFLNVGSIVKLSWEMTETQKSFDVGTAGGLAPIDVAARGINVTALRDRAVPQYTLH